MPDPIADPIAAEADDLRAAGEDLARSMLLLRDTAERLDAWRAALPPPLADDAGRRIVGLTVAATICLEEAIGLLRVAQAKRHADAQHNGPAGRG